MSAQHADLIEVAEEPFARARAHAARLEATLSSDDMKRAEHSDLEEIVDKKGREWARLMLDEHLKLRAAAEKRIEVVGADGVDRGCARDSERHLESLVGRVPVPRLAIRPAEPRISIRWTRRSTVRVHGSCRVG